MSRTYIIPRRVLFLDLLKKLNVSNFPWNYSIATLFWGSRENSIVIANPLKNCGAPWEEVSRVNVVWDVYWNSDSSRLHPDCSILGSLACGSLIGVRKLETSDRRVCACQGCSSFPVLQLRSLLAQKGSQGFLRICRGSSGISLLGRERIWRTFNILLVPIK